MVSGPSGTPSLVVVSGPGGVGKGTVVRALLQRYDDLAVSVSATTRPPRDGERDGEHYHFLDDEAFDALIAQDGFLEWAEFGGRRYGTPWSSVEQALQRAASVVLEIDVQGAMQVRRRSPEAVLIFLQPPDREALLERLRGRGTDDPDRIAERMAIAERELAQADAFDYEVVNDTVERATAEIGRILGR